jgi:hypothetical protein
LLEARMDPDERSDLIDCIDCGTTVDPAFDRPFMITEAIILCFSCATRRGGAYDSDKEKWVVAPLLDAIPEERRPQP